MRQKKIKKAAEAALIVMTDRISTHICHRVSVENKENQLVDFRLITTKKKKPRFFLLCQQFEGSRSCLRRM
jgi:hypothetical protein